MSLSVLNGEEMHALISAGQVSQFPYSVTAFRRDNPNVSFPAALTLPITAANGTIVEVSRAAKPSLAGHETAVPEVSPVLAGSEWILGWTKRDKTEAELEAERALMNPRKLALKRACEEQTDWNGSGQTLWAVATAVIANLSADQQENWELAQLIERVDSDFVALAKSPAIGATDAQIDAVFRRAVALDV